MPRCPHYHDGFVPEERCNTKCPKGRRAKCPNAPPVAEGAEQKGNAMKDCNTCKYWKRRISTISGRLIPGGYGKCTAPAVCFPDKVREKIGAKPGREFPSMRPPHDGCEEI